MTNTIWKYPLDVTDHQTVMMPKGARILAAQLQGITPYLWAIVDPKNEPEPRAIRIIGTGHAFDPFRGVHLGTVQQGIFVWHIFEEES